MIEWDCTCPKTGWYSLNYWQRYFCWKEVATLLDGWKTEKEPVGRTEFDILSEGWNTKLAVWNIA